MNGMVEQFNGILGSILTKYLMGQSVHHWDEYLDQAIFATWIYTHFSKGTSPFYLLYGVYPHLIGDESRPTPDSLSELEREDPLFLLDKARADALHLMIEKAKQNKKE